MIRLHSILLLLCATQLYANEIDRLQTDEDVNAFIGKQDKRIKDLIVGSRENLYFFEPQKAIADSLGVKPWQKVDFDNNGLTDLLVYTDGGGDGTGYLIAFIDEGKTIAYHMLNRCAFGDMYFPVLTVMNGKPLLLLHSGEEFAIDTDAYRKTMKTDSLIFDFGTFIEPNFHPTNYSIERIDFSTSMCFGTCPVFQLSINADRSTTYNAEQYNKLEGKYKTTIRSKEFEALIAWLNYIDFPKLKDQYAVNWTDDQSCTLTITYNNGQTKTISDYGEIGTYGLTTVYRMLFMLRENQKWKKE